MKGGGRGGVGFGVEVDRAMVAGWPDGEAEVESGVQS